MKLCQKMRRDSPLRIFHKTSELHIPNYLIQIQLSKVSLGFMNR
jgi:hypothetical protein